MTIGVIKEASDHRIALMPTGVKKLVDQQVKIIVERGAGLASNANDDAFSAAGATVTDRKTVLQESDLLLSIHPPEDADLDQLKRAVFSWLFLLPLKMRVWEISFTSGDLGPSVWT
jgi:NAD(P) transhydrogenase subunit alpha